MRRSNLAGRGVDEDTLSGPHTDRDAHIPCLENSGANDSVELLHLIVVYTASERMPGIYWVPVF